MARPKIIEDSELIRLVREYFDGKCDGNAHKLKLPDIACYVRTHGYPKFTVETLRRSSDVRDYIDNIKASSQEATIARVIVYKTLDVEEFLRNHPTRKTLTDGLTKLDMYYKTISDTAAHLNDENSKLKTKNDSLKAKNKELEAVIAKLQAQIDTSTKMIKNQKKQIAAYSKLVSTYVYPEIANSLLKEFDIVKSDDPVHIDPIAVKKELITPDTAIDFNTDKRNSAVPDDSIQRLMDMLNKPFGGDSDNTMED